MTVPSASDLLLAYVAAHNDGVRSGHFGSLAALFSRTGQVQFRGALARVPDCHGRAGIRAAFRRHPPADVLVLYRTIVRSATRAEAAYAWADRPRRTSGSLELTARAGLIARLVVHAEVP